MRFKVNLLTHEGSPFLYFVCSSFWMSLKHFISKNFLITKIITLLPIVHREAASCSFIEHVFFPSYFLQTFPSYYLLIFFAGMARSEPILSPFPNIANHVVQTQSGIGERSDLKQILLNQILSAKIAQFAILIQL